jgi:hypothetical protein
LGGDTPEASIEKISSNIIKVNVSLDLDRTVEQDDWQINITPGFIPDFHWTPHLTPTDDHIISQHAFRSPAMAVSNKQQQLIVIPDLDILKKDLPVKWYMDLDAKNNILTLGVSNYKVKEHVLFTRDNGSVFPEGKFEFGFYLMSYEDETSLFNPWRNILSFLWDRWGMELYKEGQPIKGSLEPYVKHTYNWAFN